MQYTNIKLIINISKIGRKLTIKKENADVEIDIVLDKTIYQKDRKQPDRKQSDNSIYSKIDKPK